MVSIYKVRLAYKSFVKKYMEKLGTVTTLTHACAHTHTHTYSHTHSYTHTCRLHAIATHVTEEFIYSHIDEQLEALGVTGTCARDLVHATSDYVELGYGRSTTEELGKVKSPIPLGALH